MFFLLVLVWFSKETRLIQLQLLSVHLLVPPLLPVTFKLSANFSQSGKKGKHLKDISIFMNFMKTGGNFPKAWLMSPQVKAVIVQPLPFLFAPAYKTYLPYRHVNGFKAATAQAVSCLPQSNGRVKGLWEPEMSLEMCKGLEGNCRASDGEKK